MKKYINGIEEGKWDLYLADWIMRRSLPWNDDRHFQTITGYTQYEYYRYLGIRHLQVEDTNGKLYEVKLLTASKKDPNWPIVIIVCDNNFEYLEEFNKFGESKSNKFKLHHECLYFDDGDYVVTESGTIGIYFNSWYLHCSIEKDGTEHLENFGSGQAYRMATPEEIEKLNDMLWVNDKKWNKETLKIENV